jgi:hypothetical protein
MFRNRRVKRTFKRLNEQPVPIVADAAVSTSAVGHGRLIPLVIVDTTNRPDVDELIRVHQHVRPGDVISQWASLQDSSARIGLLLSFKKPMELTVLLAFDTLKQGGLVDQIIHSKGLYIQSGREGDRFINNPNLPKIIMEIPDTGFARVWDDLFLRAVTKRMRQEGLTRREAKQAARLHIDNWRKFGALRVG